MIRSGTEAGHTAVTIDRPESANALNKEPCAGPETAITPAAEPATMGPPPRRYIP